METITKYYLISAYLLIAAIVCFLIQALDDKGTGRVKMGWVGMALFAGSFLVYHLIPMYSQ